MKGKKMSMISLVVKALEHKNDPLEKLQKERNKIIREIWNFEKHEEEIMEDSCDYPAPDTIYLWNLDYLIEILKLIIEKSTN